MKNFDFPHLNWFWAVLKHHPTKLTLLVNGSNATSGAVSGGGGGGWVVAGHLDRGGATADNARKPRSAWRHRLRRRRDRRWRREIHIRILHWNSNNPSSLESVKTLLNFLFWITMLSIFNYFPRDIFCLLFIIW